MLSNEIFKSTKFKIIAGAIVLVLLVAGGLQKFTSFEPFK